MIGEIEPDEAEAISPDEGQSQQGDQLADTLGVSEMGVFEAKAALNMSRQSIDNYIEIN